MAIGYQNIDLPGLPKMPGIDRSAEYTTIFPKPPTGKRILDIGCHWGYYLLRAAIVDKAGCCTGIENHRPYGLTAAMLADAANLHIGAYKVHIMGENALDIDYRFEYDVLLCMNIFHHFRNINKVIELLEKVKPIVKEKMVFVTIPSTDMKGYSHEEVRPGVTKLHISPSFFLNYFPNWYLTFQSTMVEPFGRMISILERG